MKTEFSAQFRTALRRGIVSSFNLSELRNLCADLDVDFDNLGGEGLEGKARELILSLSRHGTLAELVAYCVSARPNYAWPTDGPSASSPSRLAPPPTAATGKARPAAGESYIDFNLQITPEGHVTATSPEGQAVAEIATQPPADVQSALLQVEANVTQRSQLQQLGQALYDWLFPPTIHTHLQQTEAVARRDNVKMRVRLHIQPPAIASLPLEFLYRATGGYFLAVNPDTPLSRYLNLPLPPERLRRRAGPLHVLTIIAAPSDQAPIQPDEWDNLVRQALTRPLTEGLLTLDTVKQATRKNIRDALLRQKPDILQFFGHGVYKNGQGYLALVDEDTGQTRRVDDESFANLYLGHDDHLRLISLTTCESARRDDRPGFSGMAAQLVERGAPAVIAMQYMVHMQTTRVFLEDFYTSVAARKPIDWAVQAARNAIAFEYGLDNREFATPVLYMRAPSGDIFGRAESE